MQATNNTSQTPLVSIIIPTFNREGLIGETLQSVINQTYTNWECIVVDDGSTDNTEDIVNAYIRKEARIHFYKRITVPKGASKCRNIGISRAKGDYIIFLDSDDLLSKQCLSNRISHFKEASHLDFLVFPMLLFNNNISEPNMRISNIRNEESILSRFLRRDIPWHITSPIWKKRSIKKIQGFNEHLPFQHDYELHIRALIKNLQFEVFWNEPDSFYRQITMESHYRGKQVMTIETQLKYIELYIHIYQALKASNHFTVKNQNLIVANLIDTILKLKWHFSTNKIKVISITFQTLKDILGMPRLPLNAKMYIILMTIFNILHPDIKKTKAFTLLRTKCSPYFINYEENTVSKTLYNA